LEIVKSNAPSPFVVTLLILIVGSSTSMTFIVTVAVAKPPLLSDIVYWKLSVPKKSSFGA